MKSALALVLLLSAGIANADTCENLDPHNGLVVFDLTLHENEAPASRVFSFESAPKLTETLKVLIKNTDADGALAKVDSNRKLSSTRFVTDAADQINVICFFDESPCDITFKETKRATRIATDLRTLVQVVKEVQKKSAEEAGISAECRVYTLTETRATVDLSAHRESETAAEQIATTLITGPIEHWFLSADLPVNDVKLVKYDRDAKTLAPKKDPTTFYVGVNFKTGDLWRSEPSVLQNLVLKGFISASKHPLESYGFGIGLRGNYLRRLGLDLDLFSPFVAWINSYEDGGTTEAPIKNASRKTQTRFGLSFNLDKALGWLQGPAKEP